MRLGGHIFTPTDSPEQWAQVVRSLGYSAAYCPVGPEASSAVIAAYAAAARAADIVIAEVGTWSNPMSPDAAEAQAALEKCQAGLALADEIGARCCVNIAGSLGAKWDGPDPRNLSDEQGVSFWRPDWNDPSLAWSRHLVYNLTRPDKSLMLLGPLAKAAGGLGACKEILPGGKHGAPAVVFKDTRDPDYLAILAMAEAGRNKLNEIKRFDMTGFQPRPDYIREMVRYGVLPANAETNPASLNPYQIDRKYWDSLTPPAAGAGHALVTADVDLNQVTKYNIYQEPVWAYTQRLTPVRAGVCLGSFYRYLRGGYG
ncbi:MAG: hypothetical protein WCP21_02785, partial [Armatimonadota bacterium]